MSLFSNLSGGRSRDDATAGHKAYRDNINAYAGRARNALATGRDSAVARLDPYAEFGQSGLDANALYSNALGINGADARQDAFGTFESDPFLEYANQNTGNALRDVFRRYNAGGMGNSGANQLAVGRVAGEFARNDINNWMNRLQGHGSEATRLGYGAAGQQAGYDERYGNVLADLETSVGSAIGSSHLNNALYNAGTRSAGVNNLMRFGDLAVRAASAAMGVPSGGGSSGAQHSGAYHPWASGTTVKYG